MRGDLWAGMSTMKHIESRNEDNLLNNLKHPKIRQKKSMKLIFYHIQALLYVAQNIHLKDNFNLHILMQNFEEGKKLSFILSKKKIERNNINTKSNLPIS